MGRPAGFLWHDPGIPSITVPYHDSADFYYSGHVGAACLWLCEFWVQDWYIMVVVCVITATIEWLFLILIQTHYIIDLIAGMFVAHWCWLAAEKACYYTDVKLVGYGKKERRQRTNVACHKCGWSNDNILQRLNKEERQFLKDTYQLRKHK